MNNIINNQMINSNNGMAINQVVSRQMQEVQGAIFMAKQFPRNVQASVNAIKMACNNDRVAENAEYTFPRGGQNVTGASIRLAEVIAQSWGNIDYGIIELNNANGISEMMAYAWDLETNVRRSMIFSVKHERDTKQGKRKLTDNRDIYEMTANMGARRVRACILGVIPSYVIDEARDECKKYLENKAKNIDTATLKKEINITVNVFKQKMDIAVEHLEKYLSKKHDDWTMQDVMTIRSVYSSIKEGMAGKADFFPDLQPEKEPQSVEETQNAAEQLNEQLGLLGGQSDGTQQG